MTCLTKQAPKKWVSSTQFITTRTFILPSLGPTLAQETNGTTAKWPQTKLPLWGCKKMWDLPAYEKFKSKYDGNVTEIPQIDIRSQVYKSVGQPIRTLIPDLKKSDTYDNQSGYPPRPSGHIPPLSIRHICIPSLTIEEDGTFIITPQIEMDKESTIDQSRWGILLKSKLQKNVWNICQWYPRRCHLYPHTCIWNPDDDTFTGIRYRWNYTSISDQQCSADNQGHGQTRCWMN